MGPPRKTKTTINKRCLFCRKDAKTLNSKDSKVKSSCAVSICSIFGIPNDNPFKIIYENAHYCNECFDELHEADLILGKIEILKQNLLRFQDRVYSKLGENYFQIKNREEFKVSYKEFENGGDAVRGKKFNYDEIVKIIYEKLDQECSKWERFSSEESVREVPKITIGTQTDNIVTEEFQQTKAVIHVLSETIFPDQDDNDDASWEGVANYDGTTDTTVTAAVDPLSINTPTLTCVTSAATSTTYQYEPMDITIAAPELTFTQAPSNFDKTISCTYDPENCKRFFYDEYNLKVHIKSFHEGNPKPHECMACKKAFSEEGRLKTHFLRVHASSGSFMCEHCGKGFSWPSLLRDHVRKMHLRKAAESHPCRFCGASFDSTETQTEHEDLHRSKKSAFDCVYCDQALPNTSAAKSHYLINHAEVKFQCDQCDKVLATANSLKTHMKLHTDAYKCDQCSYTASSITGLNSHKQSHSNEKPHVCETCGTGYKYAKNLTAHMRTHTGVKPFLCNVCGANFREHSYLKRHEESHSSDYLYGCVQENCTKRFKTRENLKKHVKAVHMGIKKKRKPKKLTPRSRKPREQRVVKSYLVKQEGDIEENKTPSSEVKKKKRTVTKTKLRINRKSKMALKDEVEVEVEEPKIETTFVTAHEPMTQEELNNAVASIETHQSTEIPTTAIFENATVVYSNAYEIQPATFEIVPISTPTSTTRVATQGINIVRATAVGQNQTPTIQYRVEYKYN